jgi:hypothetical protein
MKDTNNNKHVWFMCLWIELRRKKEFRRSKFRERNRERVGNLERESQREI